MDLVSQVSQQPSEVYIMFMHLMQLGKQKFGQGVLCSSVSLVSGGGTQYQVSYSRVCSLSIMCTVLLTEMQKVCEKEMEDMTRILGFWGFMF